MLGTLVFNLIAVFFAWLESARIFKYGLKFALFTVFLFLGLRYDYGNDYMAYLDSFNSLLIGNDFYYKGNEVGWLYLNQFFLPFGFFTLQIFLAAVTGYVIYRFILKYVPKKYYWLAVFVYVFSPYQMLVLSSAMRQAVAGVIFLFAVDFIIKKKVVWYLSLITLATLFHTSAAFLYPLILISYLNWKINFPILLGISFLFFGGILFMKEIFQYIQNYSLVYFDIYEGYTKEADFNTDVGLGFVLILVMNLFTLFYMQNDKIVSNNILYKIVIASFLMIPLSFGVQMLGRLNFYLTPVTMAVYPIIISRVNNSLIRQGFITLFVLFTAYTFWGFFQSPVWEKAFGIYKTIFSAPRFY